ncbi:MAG: type I polyketide synthase [Burkholderia sp.]|uniref:Trans-AT PKS LgaD n=1 Tax=Burkholderia gladioli TaxID=28095 RepID=A0A2Z4XG05_BURGA|nr:trans-AT PKS LgaD [Burkholderia gladioli]KAF1018227.1 MAG: hypothetical protein E5299_00008 [Burkholderia gladioli]
MKPNLNQDFDATPSSHAADRRPQAGAGGCVRAPGHVDTAIIGISARYPKAVDWRQFWENLRAGRDCIVEIPPERWDWRAYHDSARGTPGRSYTRWGGFLDGIDRFDPRFFRIAPSEAEHLDPQERLFLESAYLLIEDAGYTPASLSASRRVAVFVGAMNSSYSLLASQWTLANRVSHVFDFHGPSLVVNSACSSSLSAIHLAIESLATGTSEVAIAGGVNLIMHPAHYARLASVGMLSAGSHCRAFGAGADGFVDGEGVGSVLLKPLQRAIEDGDLIYGVIKGSALNAGGRTHGYTVPSPVAQGRLVAEAIERAGFAPHSIGCVEAHGTGTELGDPIEVRGLAEAFGAPVGAAPWCALGSVKSNIGHGEGVAGIAGLTKLLLQMRHGQLAPSLHADTLNPRIDFNGTPFSVQRKLAPWPRPAGHPRRAGVSSFGAGGANAHLLVEEYVAPIVPAPTDADSPALIVLSAANLDRLRAVAQRLLDFLNGEFSSGITLAELAYTLQVGREALAERLGFVADSLGQVRACLAAFLEDREAGRPLLRSSVGQGRAVGSGMLDDESFAQTLRGWIKRGKHELLLKLWGQGEPLDWSLLYRGARPRRVSLPGYPFAGERYWAPAAVRYAGVVCSRRRPAIDPDLLLCQPTWRAASLPAATGRALPHRELWLLGSQARLDDAALPALPIERFRSEQAEPVARCVDLYGQFHARLRARLRDKLSEPLLLQVAILGRDDELLLSGLSSMLRSLGQESRKLSGQLLVMEGGEDRATWQARLDENAVRAHEDWVRYRQGRRETWALQELPPATVEPALPWRARGVYLLSGGAGGLGLLFAEEITRRAEGATVILASRSAPVETRRARLAALAEQGLAIRHAVLDITDAAAVQALVDEIVASYGRLDGVLHLAGVLRDAYLVDQERDRVDQVLAPKLLGALHLDLATRMLPLDCFVLFSSAAALFGNAGQADYASANGFLDAFAVYRQTQGRSGRSLSVNWPLWAEGGMSMDKATEQLLTAGTGIRPMRAATGCRALAHALAGAFPQVLALEGEPVHMRAALLGQSSPVAVATAGDATSPKTSLSCQVRELVAALLKVEPEQIEAGQDIGDYGLDSIGFTHLANQLNLRFGSALRSTDFMELEMASVERIARLLEQKLPALSTGTTPVTRRDRGPSAVPVTPTPRDAGPAAHSDEPLRAQVREAVAALLKVEIEEVDLDLDISDYGVDSIGFTHLANRLNEQQGTRLRATDLLELEQVSVIRIARLLREDPGSRTLLDAVGADASLAVVEGR